MEHKTDQDEQKLDIDINESPEIQQNDEQDPLIKSNQMIGEEPDVDGQKPRIIDSRGSNQPQKSVGDTKSAQQDRLSKQSGHSQRLQTMTKIKTPEPKENVYLNVFIQNMRDETKRKEQEVIKQRQAEFQELMRVAREMHEQKTAEKVMENDMYNELYLDHLNAFLQPNGVSPDGQVQEQYLISKVQMKQFLNGYQQFVIERLEEELRQRGLPEEVANSQFNNDRSQEKQQSSQQLQEIDSVTYLKNYQAFQDILRYYHDNDPQMYENVLNEYNTRMKNMLLQNLGLGDEYSGRKKNSNAKRPQQPTQKTLMSKQRSLAQLQKMKLEDVQSRNNASMRLDELDKDINLLLRQKSASSRQLPPVLSTPSNVQGQRPGMFLSQRNTVLTPSKLPQNVQDNNGIIAQRYDKTVTSTEVSQLQTNAELSENVLNFFLRYLEEKQNSFKEGNSALLIMTSTFYKSLCYGDYNNSSEINYVQAKHYTRQYQGAGKTIFDIFDFIAVPIYFPESKEAKLVLVDLTERVLFLFDNCAQIELPKQDENEILKNPYLENVSKFLVKESQEKLMKSINTLDWRLEEMKGITLIKNQKDKSLSTAYIACYIYTLYCKSLRFDTNEYNVRVFSSRIAQLISEIGLTKNLKGELQTLQNDAKRAFVL